MHETSSAAGNGISEPRPPVEPRRIHPKAALRTPGQWGIRFRFALHATAGYTAAIAKFSRVSELTGRRNTREIDVDPARVEKWNRLCTASRPFVQDAFPDLGADDREFLANGVTPEEWDELLGPEGDGPEPAVSGDV